MELRMELRDDQLIEASYVLNKLRTGGSFVLNKPSGYGKTMVAYHVMKRYSTIIYCVRENPYKFYIMDELIKYGCDTGKITVSIGNVSGFYKKINTGGYIFIMNIEDFIRMTPRLRHDISYLLVLDDVMVDSNERVFYNCLKLQTSADCIAIEQYKVNNDNGKLTAFNDVITKYKETCPKIVVNLDNASDISEYVGVLQNNLIITGNVHIVTSHNSYEEIKSCANKIDGQSVIISVGGILNSTVPIKCDLLILNDTYICTRGCKKVVQISSRYQESINQKWFKMCNKLEEFITEKGHRPFKASDKDMYYLTEWWLGEREKNIKKLLNRRYEERWNYLNREYSDYLVTAPPYREHKIGKWILMYNEVCDTLKNKRIFSRDDPDFIDHKQWLWNQVNVSVSSKNNYIFIAKLWNNLDNKWHISETLKKNPRTGSKKRRTEDDDKYDEEMSKWSIKQLESFIDKNKRLPELTGNDSNERILGVLLRGAQNNTGGEWNNFFDKYSEYFIAEKSLWNTMFCSLKIAINTLGKLPEGDLYEWYTEQQRLYSCNMMSIAGTQKSWELFLERYGNVLF